jgi:hypothetical protein
MSISWIADIKPVESQMCPVSNGALACFPILPNKHRSIRAYLSEKRRKLRIFSIVHIFGKYGGDCDFRERFNDYEGLVAVDHDEQFCN